MHIYFTLVACLFLIRKEGLNYSSNQLVAIHYHLHKIHKSETQFNLWSQSNYILSLQKLIIVFSNRDAQFKMPDYVFLLVEAGEPWDKALFGVSRSFNLIMFDHGLLGMYLTNFSQYSFQCLKNIEEL